MPTGTVTTENGRQYRVTGPDGIIGLPGVYIHHTGSGRAPVDAAAILAPQLGAPAVPTPAELYDLPAQDACIEALRHYQASGVTQITNRLRHMGGALLGDDMGLGKSVQTLGVWNALKRPVPLLIVAPASVRRNWMAEVAKWAPDVQVRLVEKGKAAAEAQQTDKVVVCSYELVGKLAHGWTPHMMVIDEAHNVRGRTTKRGKDLLEVSRVCSYVMALSGTPMWSRPRDLWMLLQILCRGSYRFGTALQFDMRYCAAYMNQFGGRENKGISNAEELQKRLAYVMVRRTKAELADQLPEKTTQVIWVPPERQAVRAFQAFALGQLKLQDALNATLNAKVAATVELAVSAEKSVIFTWMKSDVHALAEALRDEGLTVETLTGDDSHAARDEAVKRAEATGATIVATYGAAREGLNMQRVASVIIHHAFSWVPLEMAQAQDRVHRIGQGKPVTVYFVAMEDSADRLIVDTAVDKLDQWRETMGKDGMTAMQGALTGGAGSEALLQEMAKEYAGRKVVEE